MARKNFDSVAAVPAVGSLAACLLAVGLEVAVQVACKLAAVGLEPVLAAVVPMAD